VLKIGPPALLSSETITVMKCLAIRHKNAGSTVAGARCESVLYDEGGARPAYVLAVPSVRHEVCCLRRESVLYDEGGARVPGAVPSRRARRRRRLAVD